MANNQMIGTECPTLCKRARLDTPPKLTVAARHSDGLTADQNCILEAFGECPTDSDLISVFDVLTHSMPRIGRPLQTWLGFTSESILPSLTTTFKALSLL